MTKLNPYLFIPLLFITNLSIIGSVIYLLWGLNLLGILIAVILSMASLFLFKYQWVKIELNQVRAMFNFDIHQLLYLLFYIISIAILWQARTAEPISSPWQVVPGYFFVVYFLLSSSLVWLLVRKVNNSLLFITLHYLLSFSVAMVVYIVGYGFDPFIHQASISYIAEHGAVLPKTFYYLGQYVLEVSAHKLTGISLITIDKLLVPVLSALLLPAIIYTSLKKLVSNSQKNHSQIVRLIILATLILPFSFFIFTTPQSLAYLFLLIIIALGLVAKGRQDFIILYLLAIATVVTQPIAGIPAILLVMALHIRSIKFVLQKEALSLIIFLNAITLPAIFYYLNQTKAVANPVNDPAIVLRETSWQLISLPNLHTPWLNFVHLLQVNYWLLIVALIFTGILIVYRQKLTQPYVVYSLMSLAGLFSFALTAILPFDFLINYDRSQYTQRLLIISLMMLLPFIWQSLNYLFDRLLKLEGVIKIPLLIVLSIFLTGSLYLSYPRYDDYFKTRGPATSGIDLQAVGWIEADAEGHDYIVLANQQVGAGALRQLGFKRYYNDQLYYSIPTGAPLYQYYLDMTYWPRLETIEKASQLTGVDIVYFVINGYWEPFNKITASTQAIADSWHNIDDQLYIFKFDLR